MILIFVALALLASPVLGLSSGQIPDCKSIRPPPGEKSFYGCAPDRFEKDEDGNDKRTSCKDKDSRQMSWALEPVEDLDAYELFAGEEDNKQITYRAGEWIVIALRVKQFQRQYRGLLMYAEDEDGKQLGSWETTDQMPLFHDFCPGAIVHASGAVKPYLTQWRFRVPDDYTGKIRFMALIKQGGANKGEFFWPNILELTASTEPLPERYVWKGLRAQSCDEVCAEHGQQCDEDAIATFASSVDALLENVTPYVVCRAPLLSNCSPVGSASSEDGHCYYADEDVCKADNVAFTKPTCGAVSGENADGFRLCKCKFDPHATPLPTPKPQGVPTDCTAGTLGCTCDSDGLCEVGGRCNGGTCQSTSCLYMSAGCPCDLETNSCAPGLKCLDELCVSDGECNVGTLGCGCTVAHGCIDAAAQCNERSFCEGIGQPCEIGDIGCPCLDDGTCKDTYQCIAFEDDTVCTFKRDNPDDDGAASSTWLGAATMLAAVTAHLVR